MTLHEWKTVILGVTRVLHLRRTLEGRKCK